MESARDWAIHRASVLPSHGSARVCRRPPYEGGIDLKPSIRAVAAFLALTLIFAIAATPALASPVSDKLAKARRIQAQIDVLDDKVSVADEDYNQAKIVYDAVHAKVVKVQSSLSRIDKQTGVLEDSLDARADSMYRSGPLGLLDVLLGTASFEDFATTWDFLSDQNRVESENVAKLKILHVEKAAAEVELKSSQAVAKKQYDTMSNRRAVILAAQRKAKGLLKGVEKDIAALQASNKSRRKSDAKSSHGSGRGTGWNWGDPSRAPRSGVVSIALRYLGRPYVWAASGPRTFDCSGFTMFVYAQVGVHLPHSSRAQINYGARVSRANLKPGDLLFFYSPIHHVAIYIGNGKMVHAPHTGDVVSIDPVNWGSFSGACRP